MIRAAGILLPVTSLPSQYGVGTLGKEARNFIDFLADAGQTYWQILPVGPTGFGNSPYQSLSSYAGSTYLIDLEDLIDEGFLKREEVEAVEWGEDETRVDYGILYNERDRILRLAADRLPLFHPREYLDFVSQEYKWLRDYAVFMAIKTDRKGAAWQTWPAELRRHDSEEVRQEAERLKEEVKYWQRVQYFFYKQMKSIKEYANRKGIQIIGDLPFYIAADSIDAWSHPEQFEMDSENRLKFVSGFAPDGGNPRGQKWGNPLFDWNRQRSEGYNWWIERMAHQSRFFDMIRIDHFQGYLSYYAVPADDDDAVNGHWEKGPGLEIFRKCEEKIGKRQIIVEDLGQLTPEFLAMVKESGFPGMRIMQYAFDPNDPGSIYMPFQYDRNTVVYTGTHDNDTILGWLSNPENGRRIDRAKEYLGMGEWDDPTDAILRCVYGTVSDLAIVQMQDLLELDSDSRTNDPSGKTPAWTWRCAQGSFRKDISAKLKKMMLLYCRNNWNAKTDS